MGIPATQADRDEMRSGFNEPSACQGTAAEGRIAKTTSRCFLLVGDIECFTHFIGAENTHCLLLETIEAGRQIGFVQRTEFAIQRAAETVAIGKLSGCETRRQRYSVHAGSAV